MYMEMAFVNMRFSMGMGLDSYIATELTRDCSV